VDAPADADRAAARPATLGEPSVGIFVPMSAADVPAILEIERDSFPHPWTAALFLQELRVPFSRVLLSWASTSPDAALVGYICRWLVVDEVHVLNVAVHPAHRRRGVATALVREILREGRAVGACAVTLEVRRGNLAARQLYAGLGFLEDGTRPNYYGRGEDALVMRRLLGKDD
jgi:ribosomal-protein-alanine N-acetyltransferase